MNNQVSENVLSNANKVVDSGSVDDSKNRVSEGKVSNKHIDIDPKPDDDSRIKETNDDFDTDGTESAPPQSSEASTPHAQQGGEELEQPGATGASANDEPSQSGRQSSPKNSPKNEPTKNDNQSESFANESDGSESTVSIRYYMAAVIFHPGAKIKLKKRPVPVPSEGQVLVKVFACGVCRSEE